MQRGCASTGREVPGAGSPGEDRDAGAPDTVTTVLDEARELLRTHAKDDVDWGPLRRPPELDRS